MIREKKFKLMVTDNGELALAETLSRRDDRLSAFLVANYDFGKKKPLFKFRGVGSKQAVFEVNYDDKVGIGFLYGNEFVRYIYEIVDIDADKLEARGILLNYSDISQYPESCKFVDALKDKLYQEVYSGSFYSL